LRKGEERKTNPGACMQNTRKRASLFRRNTKKNLYAILPGEGYRSGGVVSTKKTSGVILMGEKE